MKSCIKSSCLTSVMYNYWFPVVSALVFICNFLQAKAHAPMLTALTSQPGCMSWYYGYWLIFAANLHLSGCSTEIFLCFILDNSENIPVPFPPLWKSYRHECVYLLFVATLNKSRSSEKGKIQCEFTGKHGEACERQQNPQATAATTQEGWWVNPGVLVTLLFHLLMAVVQYKREKLLHVAGLRVNCNRWREGNHVNKGRTSFFLWHFY